MPAFAYTALDSAGKTVSGSVSVRSKQEAYRELEKKALHPVSVREESEAEKKKAKAEAADADPPVLKRTQVILFTEELADMLDGGLQLEQALRILQERNEDPKIKLVSRLLLDEIREGTKVSVALRKSSPSFDDLYINLVAAGEASGSLSEIMHRLAKNLTVMNELQSRVVGAMIYPLFLIGACIVLLFVFSTVLMPQLADLISAGQTKMPFVTLMLVKFSDFTAQWWWAILAVMVGSFIIFKASISTPNGKLWWHKAQLGFPLIGPVLVAKFYAQFCQALGNLVNNGVPLLNGLKLMGQATPNLHLKGKLAEVIGHVAEGAALSTSMRRVGEFPSILADMLGVGEQTGNLGRSLQKAAGRYDKDLTIRIDRLTKMISPIVLIFMAGIVGVVAYAIISALFQSATGIRGNV